MIKNIFKSSIATFLLLGANVVGMDSDGVPLLCDESATLRSSSIVVPPPVVEPDAAFGLAGRLSRVMVIDPSMLLAMLVYGADGLSGNMRIARARGDCSECAGCFSMKNETLDAELAALTATKEQTIADIAQLTAKLEALDANADRASLITDHRELEAMLADTQTAIDVVSGKRTALDAERDNWEATKQARAAEEARQEAEAAAQAEGMKQAFLAQLARDPGSIEFTVENVSTTREHMSAVTALLESGNFTGLKVIRATLDLVLEPLSAAARASSSDAPVKDEDGGKGHDSDGD